MIHSTNFRFNLKSIFAVTTIFAITVYVIKTWIVVF